MTPYFRTAGYCEIKRLSALSGANFLRPLTADNAVVQEALASGPHLPPPPTSARPSRRRKPSSRMQRWQKARIRHENKERIKKSLVENGGTLESFSCLEHALFYGISWQTSALSLF